MRGFKPNRPLGKHRGFGRHKRGHCRHYRQPAYSEAYPAQEAPERQCKFGGPCIGGGNCAHCAKMAEMRRRSA